MASSSRFQDFLTNLAASTVMKFENLRRHTLSWFTSEAMQVRNEVMNRRPAIDPKDVIQDDIMKYGQNLHFDIGQMVLFNYDAKWKAKLPYWDRFPLIFPIEMYNNGYLGINMHYLPPPHRAVLMDSLYTLIENKDDFNDQERLNISYQILSSSSRYRLYKPCVKRYLYSHVRSNWSIIPIERWEMVLMLPLARWAKASETKVYEDSLAKLR